MKRNFAHLVQEHDHEHVAKWILNSKKSKRSLKIMRFVTSHDIIRGGYGKN